MSSNADVQLINPVFSMTGMRGKLVTPWGEGTLEAPLLGEFNALNLLAVISALGVRGVSLGEILPLLKQITPPVGRLQTFYYQASLVVVDYAHTPDALKQVLLTLKKITTDRLICVFGCGGNRDQQKRTIMGNIASKIADKVILTSDNPRDEDPVAIISDINAGVEFGADIEIIVQRDQAINQAFSVLKRGDILLIAGKGHEDYQEIRGQRYYFSDIDKIKNIMEKNNENLTTVSLCD
ncbi:Mur ligase family protein [Piscirickettsia litoralis]|uniref:Mur ligase family protein n=1 Tax=Piscirickettsia litoralis TaxID=1891921 RepID=UPI000A4F25AE|nr:cyanophycin synthetase [Piscirickettsia litoralis]